MLKTLLSTCGFSTLLSVINLVQYCFGEFVSKLGQLIISFTIATCIFLVDPTLCLFKYYMPTFIQNC